MSWQMYVDDHLMCDVDGQHFTSATIIGHDGSLWAASEGFPQYKPKEIIAIMNDFAEPGTLAPTGLFLGGTKYMVLQGEPGVVIRGKKGSGGVCVKKTNMALIIDLYDELMTPEQCNVVVENLDPLMILLDTSTQERESSMENSEENAFLDLEESDLSKYLSD